MFYCSVGGFKSIGAGSEAVGLRRLVGWNYLMESSSSTFKDNEGELEIELYGFALNPCKWD